MAVDAIRTRKYPLISIADKVKIYRKKGITEQERTSNWMPTIYNVERIEKSLDKHIFNLEQNTRPFLSFESLKIENRKVFVK